MLDGSAPSPTYPGTGARVLEDGVSPKAYPAAGVQVLEEFYEGLATVGVSAATGEGMDDFFAAVSACAREYEQHYLPELQRRRRVRRRTLASRPASCRLYCYARGAACGCFRAASSYKCQFSAMRRGAFGFTAHRERRVEVFELRAGTRRAGGAAAGGGA